MPQPDQEDRRVFNTLSIFALMVRCPAGDTREESGCPFVELRKGRGLEEKFLIAESLPDDKCRELLDIHRSCLARASLKPTEDQGSR